MIRQLRDPEECGQIKKQAVRHDTPVDNFTLSTHGALLPQKASRGSWFSADNLGHVCPPENHPFSPPNLDIYPVNRNYGVSSEIWLI